MSAYRTQAAPTPGCGDFCRRGRVALLCQDCRFLHGCREFERDVDGVDLLVLQVSRLSISTVELNINTRRDDIDAPASTYMAGKDELIASRHHDAVSVATILTPFTMLTFNEYCRCVSHLVFDLSILTLYLRFRSFKSFDNSMYFPISPNQSIDSDDELQTYHSKVFFW